MLLCVFFIIATLVCVKYLVVLIWISLMANNFEKLFNCLMFIDMFSLEKWLFKHFYPFLTELSFCCWIVKVIYMFLMKSFIRYIICIYFLTFHELSFLFLLRVLWTTKVPNLMTSSCLYFLLLLVLFTVMSKRLLPNPRLWRFIPVLF